MRFLLLIQADAASELGTGPDAALLGAMTDFHGQLARAGALLDAAVLQPPSAGWSVQWQAGQRRVIDGPVSGAREPVAGYALIDVRSREEALEWSRRFSAPLGEGADVQIEVRPLAGPEGFTRETAMRKMQHFSVEIDAPRRRVWHAMLDPQPYREWTSAFCEGSYYEGGWEAGQRIRFLTPSGEGMVAEIAEHRPLEFVSIRHLGAIHAGGAEDLTSDEVRAWAPAYENYTFSESGGRTRVQVDMDVLPEYEAFMAETWPKALARLKAIAERA